MRAIAGRGLVLATLLAASLQPARFAAADHEPTLTVQDFAPFVSGTAEKGNPFSQGLGDRDNSWAWSMQWWQSKGKLFIGTSRAYRCFSRASLARIAGFIFPYPPPDPDQDCAADPADLRLEAEIWSWTPETNKLERIYQSPRDVPVPGRADKLIAHDVGFRGMSVHTDNNGVEALYAVALNSAAIWGGEKQVPPPRIHYSTDGKTFTPVPQEAGTYLGELTKGSFRSPTSYDGRLFALHGTIQGSGVLIGSDEPMKGNDTWREVGPPGQLFFELAVFNGWLYLGGKDYSGGYTVLKSKADGDPYEFTTVVPAGALLSRLPGQQPSGSVVSMHVFDGRLYVGTDNPAELIRINPDDSWDLVAGAPRQAADGTWKYPLSGLNDGLAHQFNDHIWRQGSHDGSLFIGTYDASINWKDDAVYGPKFRHLLGTDVYRTSDGWYFTPVTMDGFGGDQNRFNYGTRSIADTPFGLFLGTANDFYGLSIFRATAPKAPPLLAPRRLEAELVQQRPILSWEPVPGAVRYHVRRAFAFAVQIPANPQTQSSDGSNAPPSDSPDAADPGPSAMSDDGASSAYPVSWMHDPFQEIATTRDAVFVDAPLEAGGRRLYLVTAEDALGRTSELSNLVIAPSLGPGTTFSRLLREIDALDRRGRFTSPDAAKAALLALQQASGQALANKPAAASDVLEDLRLQVQYGAVVYDPDAKDLEILISKLIRRVKLVRHGFLQQALLF